MKNKKTKWISPVICLIISLTALLSGCFIPGFIINRQNEAELDIVTKAPQELYLAPNSLLAKNLSDKLTTIDKIKLASNSWESTERKADKSESTLEEYDAVLLAKSQLQKYYEQNIYPYSFDSTYDNWYSWSTEFYCYTDSTFNTYSTYVWEIILTKYDNDLTHTIVMTENGTILNAYVNNNNKGFSSIYPAYSPANIASTFNDNSITYNHASALKYFTLDKVSYPDCDFSDAKVETAYNIMLNSEGQAPSIIVVYQYTTGENGYGIGIVPK